MWARELQEGKADPKQYLPTLEVEHALGEAFDIAKEADRRPRLRLKLSVRKRQRRRKRRNRRPICLRLWLPVT